jgi:PAS domain S-box-containing protein
MRSGPWSAAAAVLIPLVPGALIAWRPVNEGFGVVLLLVAVALACWIGGATAGAAAAVLAVIIDNLLLLPPRMSLAVSPDTAPHLLAFGAAAAGIVVVYARVRSVRAGTERARAEAEVRASALTERVELLAPLLDDAPIGFGLMDRDLHFRYVNAQFATFSGRPVADHVGHTAGEVFGAEFGHLAEEIVGRVVKTGQAERTIQLGVPRAGRERRYLTNRYPVRDSGGWIIGVGFGAIDVTERIELEESYRRASAELTATIRSSPVAIALLGTDLCFRHVNREFERLAGDPDRPLTGCALAEAGGLPPVVLAMPVDVLATGESGSAVDVPTGPAFTTVNCFPVRTDDGTLVGVALVLLDVTEQHRIARLEAEAEALRATAEMAVKLEQAQRLAGLGNWELDLASGQLTWLDQTRTIVGDPLMHFDGVGELTVHPDDVERATRLRRLLLREGVSFVDEFRLVRPDGSVIDVYCTGEAVRDEDGRPVRLWGTFQDVTAQRATERAAKEARAQLEAEHQALQMFVRAMLPTALPEVAGAEIAASYLPVVERIDIGGDWFDSFRLPDGRVALAVGDATGHDLRAATVMGQVRNAVRAYAFEDPAPGEVLRRTDLLLCQMPELGLATMVYGVYDPVSCDLTWANAGHPAPLLRHGRDVSALTGPSGAILGIFGAGVRYAEATVRLEPEDTVLWFTDGLVDHRGIDPAAAMRGLMIAFAGADDPPERLLAQVTERMLTGGVQEDDVCLLALHRAAYA